MNADLLKVLLERSEGWMGSIVLVALTLWVLSRVYNDRYVRAMARDVLAAGRAAARAFAAALRVPGEPRRAGRGAATANAAVFCLLSGLVIVEILVFAVVLLTRNYHGVLTVAQFAVGVASMAALTVFARLCRAEAYRALARR